jgi:hypothetical protein
MSVECKQAAWSLYEAGAACLFERAIPYTGNPPTSISLLTVIPNITGNDLLFLDTEKEVIYTLV